MLYRIHEYDATNGWRVIMQYETLPELNSIDSQSQWAFHEIAQNDLGYIKMGHTMWDIVSPTANKG